MAQPLPCAEQAYTIPESLLSLLLLPAASTGAFPLRAALLLLPPILERGRGSQQCLPVPFLSCVELRSQPQKFPTPSCHCFLSSQSQERLGGEESHWPLKRESRCTNKITFFRNKMNPRKPAQAALGVGAGVTRIS